MAAPDYNSCRRRVREPDFADAERTVKAWKNAEERQKKLYEQKISSGDDRNEYYAIEGRRRRRRFLNRLVPSRVCPICGKKRLADRSWVIAQNVVPSLKRRLNRRKTRLEKFADARRRHVDAEVLLFRGKPRRETELTPEEVTEGHRRVEIAALVAEIVGPVCCRGCWIKEGNLVKEGTDLQDAESVFTHIDEVYLVDGHVLSLWRRQKLWTQAEFAAKMQWSQVRQSHLEGKVARVSGLIMSRILEVLPEARDAFKLAGERWNLDGRKLAAVRASLGMSGRTFAEKAGWSPQYQCDIENHCNSVNDDLRKTILQVLREAV